MSAIPDPSAPLTAETLREAALRHLARFAATEQGLAQVLERAIMRRARKAARAGEDEAGIETAHARMRACIPPIVEEMRALGALDDAAFSRARAASLTRSGRSRRGVAAYLVRKGVDRAVMGEAMEAALGTRGETGAEDRELGAALVLARKRRLGPFGPRDAEPRDRPRDRREHERALAVLARAGFGREIAERALTLDHDEAEDRVLAFRSS